MNFSDNYSIYWIYQLELILAFQYFLEGFVLSVESYWQLSTVIDSSCYNTKCLDKVNDSTQSFQG